MQTGASFTPIKHIKSPLYRNMQSLRYHRNYTPDTAPKNNISDSNLFLLFFK